jgi:hypothetical protein
MKKLFATLAILALVIGAAAVTSPASASNTNVYTSTPNEGANN